MNFLIYQSFYFFFTSGFMNFYKINQLATYNLLCTFGNQNSEQELRQDEKQSIFMIIMLQKHQIYLIKLIVITQRHQWMNYHQKVKENFRVHNQ
ncbi:unnamed protein product [Paramecium sonneborni]|uniref:Uncharacterized protein n=1 Tax=Paramecium sonneborni TaxID=65129 RepID=A0A8S1QB23_9CILI|nr:unnamed protein product [Paramecium sonneborni]